MTTAAPTRGWLGRSLDGFDPLRSVWALLTNVKFALFLIGCTLVAMSLGVLIPQLPAPMRSNIEARSAWLELQRADFGAFTDPMYRLGLFNVFNSWWFTLLWATIIVAVTVSTVSRLRPIARSVHRPQRIVADRYFDVAHHRAAFSHPGGVEAVTEVLKKHHYTVEQTRVHDGATHLFAHRYLWTQYGTVVSHLALIMLMLGGLLTRFSGFQNTMALAESAPGAPMFEGAPANQIFITMLDAHEGKDADGNIVDFHSDLLIRRGDETVTCTSTVNGPCEAFGYRFHQAAYFEDIARLRIETPSGAVAFDDIVDFNNEKVVTPHIRVTRGETVLFDQALPQLGTEAGNPSTRADDVAIGAFVFPRSLDDTTGIAVTAAWKVVGDSLRLVLTGDQVTELAEGGSITLDGYTVTFVGAATVPALQIDDMPGAVGGGSAAMQMPDASDNTPYLTLIGVDDEPVFLRPGVPFTTSSGYTYTFGGQVEASGIDVKRDPGDTFIWLAVGMAMLGLGMTFYVPRRRLWVRVSDGRTQLAGLAERSTRFGRELRLLGAELGSRDALEAGDLDKEW